MPDKKEEKRRRAKGTGLDPQQDPPHDMEKNEERDQGAYVQNVDADRQRRSPNRKPNTRTTR